MIRVDTDVEKGVAVLQPQGRLTMVTAPQLRQVVAETVTSGRPRIVVDLSATEFLDSSGLGALIAGAEDRQAGRRGPAHRLPRPAACHRPEADEP
jgi:anti-sigma B factor antagonist